MLRMLFTVLTITALAGCATKANYEKILQSMTGWSEGALVASWGAPDSFYETGGVKYLTYRKSQSGYVPGTPPTYQTNVVGTTAITTTYGGSPGFAYTRNCRTTFAIADGTVTSWRYEGDGCVAHAPE